MAADAAQLSDQSWGNQVSALRTQFPALQHARFGYKFVELSSGRVLASDSASTFFTPASNTKLYTTAAALSRLGPEYRFRTEVQTSGTWQSGQKSVPDLLLIGGGDPDLSGRELPYGADGDEEDPLRALRQLVEDVWNAGIREVRGNVYGLATRYPDHPYPTGWTIDDTDYSYGAPVSALTLNDNTVSVLLRPTPPNNLASIELRPATTHFLISNQVVTVPGKEAHVNLERPALSNEIVLSGTIGDQVDQWREDLALDTPALWTASQFTQLLRERGISVRGHAAEASATGPCALIAVRQSAPLSEIIRVVNKVSQNLHAEMLLRELGTLHGQPGTLENGLREREAFLREIGISAETTGVALADGSGLARHGLTTPDSTVALLQYMWTRPERDIWIRSLPVGTIDGSLHSRFRHIAGAQRIHGKTGSLSHVAALSGYMEKRDGTWIAFSVMVNAAVGRDQDTRKFIDQLCALVLGL